MRRTKRETLEAKKKRSQAIAARLAESFPEVRVPLKHRNPYELLVATILSAQCTDEMVNKVTPELFNRYPTPYELARAPVGQIETLIRRLGLFRSKARALKQCTQQLVAGHSGEVPSTMEDLTGHSGEVPSTMEDLTRLSGVGRKTANVILGNAFGIPGVVVDTHVKRLARRLGFTRQEDPNKIEKDLMALLPREEWIPFSLRLIFHGRKVCHARKPECRLCSLNDLCPSAEL